MGSRLVLLVAVAIVAAAGAAYAANTGGGSSSLTLCAAHKSGALSLAKHGKCPKGKRALKIDEQGPAGTPGQDGTAAELRAEPVHFLSNAASGSPECSLTPGVLCSEGKSRWILNEGSGRALAGFQKDPAGFVHLQGQVGMAPGSTTGVHLIFYLPPGYRPTGGLFEFPVIECGEQVNKLEISPEDGDVRLYLATSTSCVNLSGITFPAG